jgi:hypothetical protein
MERMGVGRAAKVDKRQPKSRRLKFGRVSIEILGISASQILHAVGEKDKISAYLVDLRAKSRPGRRETRW